ncbi:uncharacterized protein LOC130673378 [Microplitis mediator]|uniref:uncharacterized protein LOC130673378 n=1 Tax=Microplitis mediator TaxID=375433 RepID=UPI002553FF41|nr:uncharacterized protein LOC130673378 [Microplitis mediator]
MALLEVYESDIVNYSAKGTRCNKKTGIDPSVYNAILGWARSRTSEEIKEKDFVYYVNKFIYNKRQYPGDTLSKNKPTPENKGNIQLDNQEESSSGNTLHNPPENIDEVPLDNMPPCNLNALDLAHHNVHKELEHNRNVSIDLDNQQISSSCNTLRSSSDNTVKVQSKNMSPYTFNSTDQVYHNMNKDLDFVSQGRKYPLSVENYENLMDVPSSYVPPYNLHTVNQFQNNSNWSSNYVSPNGEYSPNVTSNHIQQSIDILQYDYLQDRTYYNF